MFRLIATITLFLITTTSYHSYASSSDLFNYDEALIESKFAQLSKVENDLSHLSNYEKLSVDSVMKKNGINEYAKSGEKKNETNTSSSTSNSGFLLFINRIFGSNLTYYNSDSSRQVFVYGGGCCLLLGTGLIMDFLYDYVI